MDPPLPAPAYAAQVPEDLAEAGSPPRPRERWPADRRRAQLLEAAAAVFAERGYQGTSVGGVAAAAGVTRTLIYKYFRDTDELYLSCLRSARAELEEAFATAALAHEAPREQLRAGVTAYFEFVRTSRHRWDLLYGTGAAVAGPLAAEAAALRYATAERIALLVGAAAPQTEPEVASAAAHVISGACEQLAKWWHEHPELTTEALVDHFMTVVWGGLEALVG